MGQDYMAGPSNQDAIKAKICDEQGPFACLFESANAVECGKLASSAKDMGVAFPSSAAELSSQCEALSSGAAHDMNDDCYDRRSREVRCRPGVAHVVGVECLLQLSLRAFRCEEFQSDRALTER